MFNIPSIQSLGFEADDLIASYSKSAIDEKIKTTGCGNNPNAFCSGTNKKCLTHNFWENLEGVIGNYLSTVHLSDLVDEQKLVK